MYPTASMAFPTFAAQNLEMEIIGYIASVAIGVSLGLIGGGGSILTVPMLVYLFGVNPVAATAYSLFIVGATSVAGSFSYHKKGLVNYRIALFFGLPSIVAVYLTRRFLIPALPNVIFTTASYSLTKDLFLMLLFAVLMVVASISMIRKPKIKLGDVVEPKSFNGTLIILEGMVVGTLTGMVGAGGGFLIIPALVVLAGLGMKTAVGTSLVIIAAKSLLGFLGEPALLQMDWKLIFTVTGFALAGIFAGSYLSRRIDGNRLKPAFGWFVLVMGLYILLAELF